MDAVPPSPAPIEAREAHPVRSLAWERRVLVVFAPGPNDDAWRAQAGLIADARSGYDDRDLTVFAVFDEGGARRNGLPIPDAPASFAPWRTGTGFEAVLIGKDGGVKLRALAPVSADQLFALIDAMPMRRQEMRERGR